MQKSLQILTINEAHEELQKSKGPWKRGKRGDRNLPSKDYAAEATHSGGPADPEDEVPKGYKFPKPQWEKGEERAAKKSLEKAGRKGQKKGQHLFEQHQTRIAKRTLNMPDAMVGVMGGPSKKEAKEFLDKEEPGWMGFNRGRSKKEQKHFDKYGFDKSEPQIQIFSLDEVVEELEKSKGPWKRGKKRPEDVMTHPERYRKREAPASAADEFGAKRKKKGFHVNPGDTVNFKTQVGFMKFATKTGKVVKVVGDEDTGKIYKIHIESGGKTYIKPWN